MELASYNSTVSSPPSDEVTTLAPPNTTVIPENKMLGTTHKVGFILATKPGIEVFANIVVGFIVQR